jgi:hypothetical protein
MKTSIKLAAAMPALGDFQQKVCEWADNPLTDSTICGKPATHKYTSYTGNPNMDAPFPLCAKHFKMYAAG